MSAVDSLLQRIKGGAVVTQPSPSAGPRFLVTKLSWRGQYHRVLCITPTALVTQFPETGETTNVWTLVGDADIVGIDVGANSAEGGVFTLHFAARRVRGCACWGMVVGGEKGGGGACLQGRWE